MHQSLQNKFALITGGSRGIGAAIVKRLAREGTHVALTYHASPDRARLVAAETERLGVKALMIQADSGDANAVKAVVEQASHELGGLERVHDTLAGRGGAVQREEWTTNGFRT